jgi:uncharacterized repeat protein (TIGR03803 family)
VYTFTNINVNNPPVVNSQGTVLGSYSTSTQGNKVGGVFEILPGGSLQPNLYTFLASNGYGTPNSRLVLDTSGTNFALYGTTVAGGANNGIVFEVNGSGLKVLATLDNSVGDGPGDLLLANGVLYGTTNGGGENSAGSVFSLPVGGGTPKILGSFNETNGNGPFGGLVLDNGTLYGTTFVGGAHGSGTVFSVPAAGGTIKDLADFPAGTNADGHLVVSNGELIGAALLWGENTSGAVFRVPVGGLPPGVPPTATLLSTSATAPEGVPGGLVVDGNLILGEANNGGAVGGGAIFEVDPTTLGVTTLVSFSHHDATAFPYGGLSVDSHGNVYGVSGGPQVSSTPTAVLWELSGLNASTFSFGSQPKGALAGQSIGTVTVSVPADSGPTVTLSLSPASSGAKLSPPSPSAPVIGGVATFTGLSVNLPGTYSLVASDGGLRAFSNPFTISAPQTTFTWTGEGDGTWTNPNDWLGKVVPQPGRPITLVFPANAGQKNNLENVPGLDVNNLQISGAYQISGGTPLTLSGKVSVNAPGGTSTLGTPVVLAGNVTATATAGELDFVGKVGGAGGIVIVGPGTIGFIEKNSYSGATDLLSGTLKALGGTITTPLGTGPLVLQGGTFTTSNSYLQLANPTVTVGGNVIIAGNDLGLTGRVQASANSVLDVTAAGLGLSGPIAVPGPDTLSIRIKGGSAVSLSGAISGHVQLAGGAGGAGNAFIQGILSPGAVLDVLPDTDVNTSGGLNGSGTVNIVGGTFYEPANNLATFQGTLTLRSGTLKTAAILGTGNLNLLGGTLVVDNPLNLVNAQTTLGNNIEIAAPFGGTVVFHQAVTVPSSIGVMVIGKVDFPRLNVSGSSVLTFSGSGTVGLSKLDPIPSNFRNVSWT